jgi:Spy/CpxP family protein refolding chaperone
MLKSVPGRRSNQPRDASVYLHDVMRTFFTVGLTGMLALAITGIAMAQENAPQAQWPNQASQGIHGPRSIDQELDHLTKDLELTPDQRKQIRPLLQEHHDRIQALFDKNPGVSRQDLGPQIHAISDETHHEIHALLTEHQKQLEKAMQERMHDGEESRRPAPSTPSK